MEARSHILALELEGLGAVSLHMLDWGDAHAAETVICVHGLTRNARDFDRLAAALAQRGKRVLALDMPGRGGSPWLQNPMHYGYPLYVAAVLGVMDNFHLRSVEWVGTSMGGIIGMMIAATQPKRIKRMVINDIGAQIAKDGLERVIAYVRDMPKGFVDEAGARAYVKDIIKPFGIVDAGVEEEFLRSSIELTEDGWRLTTDTAIAEPLRVETKEYTEVHAVDLSGMWEHVTCPALILRGEDSDLLRDETMRAMLAANYKAQAEVIRGCGHAPSLTTPEQIALVARFLEGRTALHAAAIGA